MNTRILTAGLLILGLASVTLIAGSLTPPAGPVAPTPGPESRIPINATTCPGDAGTQFRIAQSGSYYLTGNVTGVSGKVGIQVTASGVSIDLNGYEMLGVGTSTTSAAIATNTGGATITGLCVRNGFIRNWGGTGVSMIGCVSGRISDLTISGCLGGTFLGTGSIIERCTVTGCSVNGISAPFACTVVECNAYNNTGTGITVSNYCVVDRCVSQGNTSHGISAFSQNRITNNLCTGNGVGGTVGAGISAGSTANRIEGNHCAGSDIGIQVLAGANFIARNTCSGNSTNWSIVAGNAVAPIIQASTTAGAISGNSAPGVSLGSTDPNANYTH